MPRRYCHALIHTEVSFTTVTAALAVFVCHAYDLGYAASCTADPIEALLQTVRPMLRGSAC